MSGPRWGIVSTIKAPDAAILGFAAHHLELGAHRVHIYLDADAPRAEAALKAHPKCRVTRTDSRHWVRRGGVAPAKHQVRQTRNATDAYGKRAEIDWLAHIDVDEFLVPAGGGTVADALAALPGGTRVARVRPVEALATQSGAFPTHFKAFHIDRIARQEASRRVYPTFGRYLSGGMLSHVAGKIAVRTGLPDVELRIHNAFRGAAQLEPEAPLDTLELCHFHAPDYDTWMAHYAYRLDKGSYRADLNPAVGADRGGGLTLNALFREIEAADGPGGLRAFFDEVCRDSADLRERLAAEGLLRHHVFDPAAARARVFPGAEG